MPRLAVTSLVLAIALGLACDSGPPQPAHVRIAHLVPDGPAANVCLKPDGTATYETPFVQGGLSFASISTRANVDAGTYSLRIVPGAATDCDTSLPGLGDVTGLTFGDDGSYTVGLMGRLGGSGPQAVRVLPYVDDTSPPASPSVKVRYLHAAPELPTVDVGTLSTFFTPLVSGLPYAGTSNPAYVQYNSAIGGEVLGLRENGTSNLLLQGSPFNVSSGNVATLFIVGRPSQTTGDQRLSFLVCLETAASCYRFP